ncbi:MAG: hypothetical protein ACR2QM_01640 [Longimicrobiales bacterium]
MFWSLIFVLVLLIPILTIVLDSPVGKAIAARLERNSLGPGEGGMHDRMVFLEGEVERLGAELGRLDEESQFLQKLLDERPEREGLPPGPSD